MIEKTFCPKVGKSKKDEFYDSLITRVTRTPESWDELKSLKSFSQSIEDEIAEYEEWAQWVLNAAGLPDTMRPVARSPGGTWTEIEGRPANNEEDCLVLELVKGKELSQEWYAAQVLFRAHSTRRYMDEGNARNAVYNSIRMVHDFDQAFFRREFEKDVLINRSRREESKAGKRKQMNKFMAEYRTTRDDPENIGLPRATIIDLIDLNYTFTADRMIALAKAADKEDGFTRHRGRPHKKK